MTTATLGDIWKDCFGFEQKVFRKKVSFTTCATLFEENGILKIRIQISNKIDKTIVLSNLSEEFEFEIIGIKAVLKVTLFDVVINPNDVQFVIKLEVKFCLLGSCTDYFEIITQKVSIRRFLEPLVIGDISFSKGQLVSFTPTSLIE